MLHARLPALLLPLVFGASLALAQAPPATTPAPGAFTFPPKIGLAELVNVQDFEKQSPGLGQVGQYRFQGWRMGVYVYDKKRTDIPAEANPEQSRAEANEGVLDVRELQKRGEYVKVEEGQPFAVPPFPVPAQFFCRSLRLERKPQPNATKPEDLYDSFICATTWRKKFVKVRLSAETPASSPATVFVPAVSALELLGRMLGRM